MHRPGSLLLAVALLVGGGGCVFFEPINARPTAQVRKLSPGPHYRGDRILFQADKFRDPDGSPVQLAWRARACATGGQVCDSVPIADVVQPSSKQLEVGVPRFRADGAAVLAVRVELTVTDQDGAEAIDSLVVDILNHAPTLALQSQGYRAAGGGYPLGTTVVVVAQAEDVDGDAVALQWALTPPPGSVPGDLVWEPMTETAEPDHRLRADIAGLWTVSVTANDGETGGVTVETLAILVQPDQPPCVLVTDPAAQTSAALPVDAPRVFAVRVVGDDLDPYPAPVVPSEDGDGIVGVTAFAWSIKANNGAREPIATTSSMLRLEPSDYAPGDRVQVRVEVSDRKPRILGCADDEPTCSLDGDQCLQRISWEVEIR